MGASSMISFGIAGTVYEILTPNNPSLSILPEALVFFPALLFAEYAIASHQYSSNPISKAIYNFYPTAIGFGSLGAKFASDWTLDQLV